MQTTTVTQKGQVTIPAPIRKALGLKKGDQVRFSLSKNKEATLKVAKKTSIMDLFGSLKSDVKPDLTGQELIRWEKQAWPEAAAERDNKTKDR